MGSNAYIIAGPNGAGKTTFAREFRRMGEIHSCNLPHWHRANQAQNNRSAINSVP